MGERKNVDEKIGRIVVGWGDVALPILGAGILVWQFPVVINNYSETKKAWVDMFDEILRMTPFDSWNAPLFLLGVLMVSISLYRVTVTSVRACLVLRESISFSDNMLMEAIVRFAATLLLWAFPIFIILLLSLMILSISWFLNYTNWLVS